MKLFSAKPFEDALFSVIYSGTGRTAIHASVRHGDMLLVGDLSGNVTCIDLNKGKQIWKAALGKDFLGFNGVFGDTLFATAEKRVLAVDIATGTAEAIESPEPYRLMSLNDAADHCLYSNVNWYVERKGKNKIMPVWRFDYASRTWSTLHEQAVLPMDLRRVSGYDDEHFLFCQDERVMLWNFKKNTLTELFRLPGLTRVLSFVLLPGGLLLHMQIGEERLGPLHYYSFSEAQAGRPEPLPAPDTEYVCMSDGGASVRLPGGAHLALIDTMETRVFYCPADGGMPRKLSGPPEYTLRHATLLPDGERGDRVRVFWNETFGNKKSSTKSECLHVGYMDTATGDITLVERYLATPGGRLFIPAHVQQLGDIFVVLAEGRYHIMRLKPMDEPPPYATFIVPRERVCLPSELEAAARQWPGTEIDPSIAAGAHIDPMAPRDAFIIQRDYDVAISSLPGTLAWPKNNPSAYEWHSLSYVKDSLLRYIGARYSAGEPVAALEGPVRHLYSHMADHLIKFGKYLLKPWDPEDYHALLTILALGQRFTPDARDARRPERKQSGGLLSFLGLRRATPAEEEDAAQPRHTARDLAFFLTSRRPSDGADALLHALFARLGRPDMPGKDMPLQHKVYEPLLKALAPELTPEEKLACLTDYLNGWYKGMSLCAWHNAHKSSYHEYQGYWAFEAALAVRLEGLDDSSLRGLPHYPQDLY